MCHHDFPSAKLLYINNQKLVPRLRCQPPPRTLVVVIGPKRALNIQRWSTSFDFVRQQTALHAETWLPAMDVIFCEVYNEIYTSSLLKLENLRRWSFFFLMSYFIISCKRKLQTLFFSNSVTGMFILAYKHPVSGVILVNSLKLSKIF